MSLVQPDAPIRGELVDWTPPEDCQVCGANRAAGPEGDAWDPAWHCWSCGYVPGQDLVGVRTSQVDYGRMQQMVANAVETAMSSPQMQAARDLLARLGPDGIARLQEQEAARVNPPPGP